MTARATNRPRETLPPFPTSSTASASGVRPLVELRGGAVSPSLRSVSIRTNSAKYRDELTVEFVQDSHFVAGLSEELACSGIFVATYQRLPIGTNVNLSVELPYGHVVEASGVVRWTRERAEGAERPGLGILFTEISHGAVAAVAEYCRLRPPLYFEL
jgi:uncharacterized protein (TIGR02266 family)